MKLLITTQKLDLDATALSFFHGWIEEFARQCESVTVICLYKGRYNLPENVRVLSLGKEDGESRLKYFIKFYKYIWQERKNYDSVFVHMNQIYVILGGFLWRMLGKKISIWYAHGKVANSLKLAEKMTNIIFTSTKEGCRLESSKIKIVGQGIDVEKFKKEEDKEKNNKTKIVSVGRISPIKKLEVLIEAAQILHKKYSLSNFEINIIGGPLLSGEEDYVEKLKKQVVENDLKEFVHFLGSIPHEQIISSFQNADIYGHTGNTGSLDKVALEAMACECPVITCNDAVKEVLRDYPYLIYKVDDSQELAERIEKIIKMSREEKNKLGQELRNVVQKDHSLPSLIGKIVNKL